MPLSTYDLATDIGKLRALIGDAPVDGAGHFSDGELQVYLDLEGGDLRLGAATALDAWAATFSASQSVALRIGDYSETPVGATGMAARAKTLRELARTTPAFAIASMNHWDSLIDVLSEEGVRW